MSRLYVTGTDNRDRLEALAAQLRDKGYSTRIPSDFIDEQFSEEEALRARLIEVLHCDAVVTTMPTDGNWGLGAQREVVVARAAGLRVIPSAVALQTTTI